MIKYISNEKGSSLVLLLIVMVVLTLLGTSLLSVSLAEAKHAIRHENNAQAYYIAKSGAEIIANAIISDQSASNINGIADTTFTGNINGNNYEVFVHDVNGDKKNLRLEATGIVNGVSETLYLSVSKGGSYFMHAIFGDELLGLGGSHNTTVIGGDVGTNASSHTGNITFIPSGNSVKHNEGFDFDPIDTSVYDDNDHTSINKINSSLEIILANYPAYKTNDEGHPVVLIKVGEITLSGNDAIIVTGPGDLHLLIEDSFTLNGANSGLRINSSTPDTKVYIDYNSTTQMTMNGQVQIDGYIYAPNATIRINGGVGSIIGSMTAKKIDIRGGNFTIEFNENLSTDTIDVKFRKQEWSYD